MKQQLNRKSFNILFSLFMIITLSISSIYILEMNSYFKTASTQDLLLKEARMLSNSMIEYSHNIFYKNSNFNLDRLDLDRAKFRVYFLFKYRVNSIVMIDIFVESKSLEFGSIIVHKRIFIKK